jgi:ribosomal protein S27AE
MSKKKLYKVRLYVTEKVTGNVINMLLRLRNLRLQNSFDGANGILAIYDVSCDCNALNELIRMGVSYFPLDNYEDFVITCPECGERIDDDMILTTYDENLLSGYNIMCHRCGCGTQMANVEFLKR